MILRITSLLLFVIISLGVAAQNVSGRIVSATDGEPLPYASIYVQETGSGTVTNENGFYNLKLKKAGSYTLVFQYLGYSSVVKQLGVSGQQSLDIELSPESFDLETIEVIDGGEDKSYSVIRRAIAKADYHLNQVDKYDAKVYIKGSGRVTKISKITRALIPKEDRGAIDTSQVFTSESLSKIAYSRPNTFKQDVISTYQHGDVPVDATPYLLASFYEPQIAQAISPLAPRAFGYYKFEHQGVFYDRGNNVNRIKVTPRSKGEQVFSGYINIVEGNWAIHSLELTAYRMGISFLIKQTYAPVETNVWMPVNTTAKANGSIMGVSFEGNYISTVSDYNITLNPDLPTYIEVIDEKTNPEIATVTRRTNKGKGLEDKLANGGQLTRKEMRRLMREYEKQERKEAEEPEIASNYTFNQDSSKGVRDTAFWATVRPVPLTTREVRSYAIQDSIAIADSSDIAKDGEDGKSVSLTLGSSGTSVNSFSTNRWKIIPHLDFFNAVEGYALGGSIGKGFSLAKKQRLDFNLNGRYGFAWRRGTFNSNLSYRHKSKKMAFEVEGGRYLRQYDDTPAINSIIGTIAMLLSHNNYLNLYERTYGKLSFSKALSPALTLSTNIVYEDRKRVNNHSNQGWLNTKHNTYDANEPYVITRDQNGSALQALAPAATLHVETSWQPGLRYQISNGTKSVIDGSAPMIKFAYRAGIPQLGNSKSDFHQLQASYRRNFQIGIRGKVSLMVRGGAFVSNNFAQLPDYKHFATSEIFITNGDPVGSYRLLPYYGFSTNEHYGEFYGHYQFRKFLLSRIWGLQKRGIREDLFVNYLYTPDSDHYTELGYTIDNIFRFVRVEFVTSWQKLTYRDFGIRISAASMFGRN